MSCARPAKIIAIVFPANGRKLRSPLFSLAFTSTARFNTSRTFFVPGRRVSAKGAEHRRRAAAGGKEETSGERNELWRRVQSPRCPLATPVPPGRVPALPAVDADGAGGARRAARPPDRPSGSPAPQIAREGLAPRVPRGGAGGWWDGWDG